MSYRHAVTEEAFLFRFKTRNISPGEMKYTMKKPKSKTLLRPDSVVSDTFHVGIELELVAECNNGEDHDDDSCYDSRRSNVDDFSESEILRDHIGISRDSVEEVRRYFDFDAWRDRYMEGYDCDGGCGFYSSNGNEKREEIESELTRITGNDSFKVVSDSSISTDSNEIDAEVCWNYFASKETLADNEKILSYLSKSGCDFNSSCGLHINLNNYLDVPKFDIPAEKFDFLFNFVGKSRRRSSYCNQYAHSGSQKYSMVYNQGDRLEFRFFSPTLSAEKLNHYVTLANVIYRRLAGKNAKLPKKSMTYFLEKMTGVNGVSKEIAFDSLKKLNSLRSVEDFKSVYFAEKEEKRLAEEREAEMRENAECGTWAEELESAVS